MNDLQKSIIRTVAWFSMFDYAPTGFEVWKWLTCRSKPWRSPVEADEKYSLEQVLTELDSVDFVDEYLGHYGLAGQTLVKDLVALRQERYLDAWRKFRRLRRVARVFGLLPGVRAVAAANTLAWSHTRAGSDIDLFIVVRPGTIWSTRLLLVLPFALLKLRPGKGRRDPLCFSFFTTSEQLNFSNLCLPESDPYMAMWVRSLIPIFDRDQVLVEFAEQNSWVDQFLPQAQNRTSSPKLKIRPWPALIPQPKWFEKLAKKIQLKRLPERLQEKANQDSRVIISDNMLKFHDNDRRAEYKARWQNLCQKYEAS